MARSQAKKATPGTRTKRSVGAYGSTRGKERQAHRREVREARPRVQRAKAEVQAEIDRLAELERKVNGRPHEAPVRYAAQLMASTAPVIEEAAPAPALSLVPSRPKPTPKPLAELTPEDVWWAEALIAQGYHISRVVDRTGCPPELLKHLIHDDGYAR